MPLRPSAYNKIDDIVATRASTQRNSTTFRCRIALTNNTLEIAKIILPQQCNLCESFKSIN